MFIIEFKEWFWWTLIIGILIGAGIVLGIWRFVHWMDNDDYKYRRY